MKSIIILFSYHHGNTEKIAKEISKILKAEIMKPSEVEIQDLASYDLIGFGSGIYSAKHHQTLLSLAEKLPSGSEKKAFLFSTGALSNQKKMIDDHCELSTILVAKGYEIIDHFQCRGFNTNSFMKYLGGMNKGRPNAEDLSNARSFAENLLARI
jgi:flavodoxin